jgi:MFS family permease
MIVFLSALEVSIIATALPQITNDAKNSNEYVWIANSYLLAQTVAQPPIAQLCNIFGRRSPMLVCIALFMIGSGVAGSAESGTILIVGRTIQGLGSGGIMLLVELTVCDLVPLRERAKYLAIVMSTAAIGAIVGPVVGGALAERSWRWIFYLNIIAGLALGTMIICLRLKYIKEPTWRHALARVDWLGSVLFIGAMCALLLGLVMGRSVHSWSSWRVILPLVLGGLLWIGFHMYEVASPWFKEPVVPKAIFAIRTSLVGFLLVSDSLVLLQ